MIDLMSGDCLSRSRRHVDRFIERGQGCGLPYLNVDPPRADDEKELYLDSFRSSMPDRLQGNFNRVVLRHIDELRHLEGTTSDFVPLIVHVRKGALPEQLVVGGNLFQVRSDMEGVVRFFTDPDPHALQLLAAYVKLIPGFEFAKAKLANALRLTANRVLSDADTPSPIVKETITKVMQLANLSQGWDGHKASPIDPSSIAFAVDVIQSLDCELTTVPVVAPIFDGRFQLEWHEGERSLEVEFESPTSIRYLKWSGDEDSAEEDSVPAADAAEFLTDLIEWFDGNG